MNWEKAKEQLLTKIKVGDKIDPKSKIREVIEVPSSLNDGYKVLISNNGTSIIITMDMLRNIFIKSVEGNKIYNKSVIYGLYKKQVDTHSCFVHVVGRLFTHAEIMVKYNSRNFKLII